MELNSPLFFDLSKASIFMDIFAVLAVLFLIHTLRSRFGVSAGERKAKAEANYLKNIIDALPLFFTRTCKGVISDATGLSRMRWAKAVIRSWENRSVIWCRLIRLWLCTFRQTGN
jgi:hypothetical protein